MRLLGEGVLMGLHARGVRKLERDPILRNARIREEQRRAHMRALIAIAPARFPPGTLGRVERFHVELTRVAPAQHQLAEDELPDALAPVQAGVALHLGLNPDHIRDHITVQALGPQASRATWVHRQLIGPWSVRFTVHDDSPTQSTEDCSDFDPGEA